LLSKAIGITEIKVGPLSKRHFLPLQSAVETDFLQKLAVKQLLFKVLEALKIESEKAVVCVYVLCSSGLGQSEYTLYGLW
jgi:hypothetical protein